MGPERGIVRKVGSLFRLGRRSPEVPAPHQRLWPLVRVPRRLTWVLGLGVVFFAAAACPQDPAPAVAGTAGPPLSNRLALEPVIKARTLRGLTSEVAALVLGSQAGGQIAISPLAAPYPAAPGQDGKTRVAVFVEIDGPSFLDHNQAEVARVEVYAYALKESLGVAGYLAEVFAVDVGELGESIWQRGLKFSGDLQLPPGTFTLRVLVRNYHSQAWGLAVVPLAVPDFADEPALLAPFFPGPQVRDGWLAVSRDTASSRQDGYPFVVQGEALSPATRPVLVARRELDAYLPVHDLPPDLGRGSVELGPEDGGGETLTAGLEVLGRDSVGPGLEVLALRFALPDLEMGEYSLRVRMEGLVSAPVPVLVLSKATREREVLWPDLRWRPGGIPVGDEGSSLGRAADTEPMGGSDRVRGRGGRRIRSFALAYREVLTLLVAGEELRALDALLELESGVLRGTLKNGVTLLGTAQYQVAQELAAQDVKSLFPLVLLHEKVYNAYRNRRLFSLAFHTRRVIEGLAEIYAETGASEEAQRDAARVLSYLAGHLQGANLPASSRRLFAKALDYDPGNHAALLGLAASHEKYGEYARAAECLERAVESAPESSESLLRLAMNLARTSGGRRSREALRRVLATEGPSWTRSLAYEELARSYLKTGSLEEATRILEAAVNELPTPERHGSVVLLAHLYDRQLELGKAGRLLATLRPVPDPGGSPRMIYDRWPQEALETIRRSLSENARAHREILSRSLSDGAGEK